MEDHQTNRRVSTRILTDEKGSFVGRVDPETGVLFTKAGNVSFAGSRAHGRRRRAADRLGIRVSPEVERMEASHVTARELGLAPHPGSGRR